MTRFDILDRATRVNGHRLIEASAGTGKTFSIENILTRLLIDPLSSASYALEDVLVVTFTRMATRDLKQRILKQFKNALAYLEGEDDSAPDYIQAIDNKKEAAQKLRDACFLFDNAQIFTIHGFCCKMLKELFFEAKKDASSSISDEGLPLQILEQLFADYMRISEEELSNDLPLMRELIKEAGGFSDFKRHLIQLAQQPVRFTHESVHVPMLNTFIHIAKEFQAFVQEYLVKEDIHGPDKLLHEMLHALQHPAFLEQVQKRYKVAIIDEFQDTDPVQWQIFHKLFLEAKEQKTLILVGDPKQSIYAFRQADIYTYLEAAEKLGKEAHYSLDTNYRSQPSLLKALNAVFTCAGPWLKLPRINQCLPFEPVRPGLGEDSKVFTDGKGAVHFFLLKTEKTRARKRKSLLKETEKELIFPYIATEIIRLKEQESIHYGQCAILVNDRYQGKAIGEQLRSLQVPVCYQRLGYLNEGDGLRLFEQLVEATLEPTNRSAMKIALGSSLFCFTHEDLRRLDEEADWERYISLFAHWKGVLESCGSYVFLREVLHSDIREGGTTLAERLMESVDGRDLYNELLQIADCIAELTERKHLRCEDIPLLLSEFDGMAQAEENAVKKQIDISADAVKILTMHASKGLEFEVVFALGINTPQTPPRFYRIDRGEFVPLEGTADEAACRAQEESDAEKLRQLYVTMTRAKYRLYVPYMSYPSKLHADNGEASPLELLLAHLQNPSADYSTLYTLVNSDLSGLLAHLSAEVPEITYEWVTEKAVAHAPCAPSKIRLDEPILPQVPGNARFIVSYSKLARHMQPTEQVALMQVPADFSASIKNTHTLPSSNETGLILHEIFEKIPFSLGDSQSSVHSFVQTHLLNKKFLPWTDVLSSIVYNTLNCDIDGFQLRSLSPLNQLREHEFLLPGDTMIDGHPIPPGFLKGVIDLLFSHNGLFYIVDWKSNWLGPTFDSYTPQALEAAMQANDYHLQASIYSEAVHRYLHTTWGERAEGMFGGCYYLFVRGLCPGNEPMGIKKV